jgi:hypothetical protein
MTLAHDKYHREKPRRSRFGGCGLYAAALGVLLGFGAGAAALVKHDRPAMQPSAKPDSAAMLPGVEPVPYFPSQFTIQASEIETHIEAF